MSGEIGGVLIGGAVLLGAMPLILMGVAAVGAAAGVAKAGEAAVKAYQEEEERRKREEALEISQCGAELSQVYGRFQDSLNRRAEQSEQFYAKLRSQLNQTSEYLRDAVKRAESGERIEAMTRQARRDAAKAMEDLRTKELARIRAETERETGEILAELENIQKVKQEAVDWNAQTAAARVGQEAMARDLMRDAEASANLAQRLAASFGDDEFLSKSDKLSQSYKRARDMLEAGNNQAAAAAARRIVTDSASLIREQEGKQEEKRAIRALLEARLEGVLKEMDAQSRIRFTDELYGEVEESPDDFTQGAFSRLREEIRRTLDLLRSEESRKFSAFRLERLLDQTENEWIPRAEEIIRVAHEQLTRYYERLHALQIIGNYMKEQGYIMEWAQSAGDDMTQKLVVHFREPGSGNTIAVSLDEDADAEDIGKMAMEVMLYYKNGRPVSESEKAAIRKGMLDALKKTGVGGSLACTGCVDQEASDKTMDDMDAVRELPARSVFQNI